MPGGKKKDVSASSSKPTTLPPKPNPPKRSNTGSSSKSNKFFRDEDGKLSPKKAFSTFLSRSTPSAQKVRNKPVPPREAGKGKEIVRSESTEEMLAPGITVDINSGNQPVNWIMYTVPYDRTCQSEYVRWAGSDSYNMKQASDEVTRGKLKSYVNSFTPKKEEYAAPLTVFLRFTKAMEKEGDQAFLDVKKSLEPWLWFAENLNLIIDLRFDTEADPRLAEDDYISMTVNLVQEVITMLQNELSEEPELMMSGAIQEDRPLDKSKVQEGGVEDLERLMSGATLEDHPRDPDIQVCDFVIEKGSGRVQRTMSGNSGPDVDEDLERRGRSIRPVPGRHIHKGDERDDVIMPAPPKW